MLKTSLLVTLAAVALNAGANAQTIALTINNPSFETPAFADGGYGVATPAGYTLYTTGGNNNDPGTQNTSGVYTGDAGQGTPSGADGAQVLFLNNFSGGQQTAVYQDVGLLAANTTYTLTVAIGGPRLDNAGISQAGTISLYNTVAATGPTAGTSTLLSSTTGYGSTAGAFQDFTTTFTTGATVANDLTFQLSMISGGGIGTGGVQADFDNVRLTASPVSTVPEPSTYAMMLGGVGLLMLMHCARRKAAN